MRKPAFFLMSLLLTTVFVSSCFSTPKTESKSSQSTASESSRTSKAESVAVSVDESQAVSPVESEESRVKVTKLNYIAFGDSIARGAALASPETNCYPALVSAKIKAVLEDVTYQNFAIDGQTSPQLLELLKIKGDAIKSADVITLSTGANNILGIFIAKATSIITEHGFTMSDVFNAGKLFSDVLSGSADPTRYQQLLLVFSELNSYISSEEFDVQIVTAAAQLESDLSKIITEIRKNNKDAVIVINTIYNPYAHLDMKISGISLFSPSNETEKAVKALNKVIYDKQDELGYIVAPVYEGFNDYKGSERLENAFFSFESIGATNIDVHPTKAGHELIADIVFDTINQKFKLK